MRNHVLAYGELVGKYKKHNLLHRNNTLARTRHFPDEEMKILLNEQGICLSVIVPLPHSSKDQTTDSFHLKKAVREACTLLAEKDMSGTSQVVNNLERLQEKINFSQGDKGVGIYVTKEMSFYTTFPFDVTEKTVIDHSVVLRELLIKEQYSVPYNVLYIDDREIRLYRGKMSQLSEVKNKDLPISFEEGHDDQINGFFSRNSITRNGNGDRGTNNFSQERRNAIFRKADELLHPYLQNSGMVVLCGLRRCLTEFINRTVHGDQVINILYGNYSRFSETDFGEMIWPVTKNYLDESTADDIVELNEKKSEGLTEEGVVHVWDAIASDRGTTLLVEKNFAVRGYVEYEDPSRLYLHPPRNPHAVLHDAVDEIIKTALLRDIQVVFVKDGLLSRNMRIALVTKF